MLDSRAPEISPFSEANIIAQDSAGIPTAAEGFRAISNSNNYCVGRASDPQPPVGRFGGFPLGTLILHRARYAQGRDYRAREESGKVLGLTGIAQAYAPLLWRHLGESRVWGD
ncbi:MAG: hypothetical protein EBR81_11755 [Proteobacteria bacterium]|nr:hypothetical protein [Pseudomonadota bacterium]